MRTSSDAPSGESSNDGPTEITSRLESVGIESDDPADSSACSGPSASTSAVEAVLEAAATPLQPRSEELAADDGAETASSAAPATAETDDPDSGAPAAPFAFTFSLQASSRSSSATYDLAAPMIAKGDTPQSGAAGQAAGVRSSGKVKTKGRRPAEFDLDEAPSSPPAVTNDQPLDVKFDPSKFSLSF